MKGAQLGFTEVGSNFVGYAIDMCPAPIMFIQPTEEMVMRTSKVRIAPLIEACPELAEKVSKNKSRDSKNTIMQKNFMGGTLYFAGANSPAGLSSVPIRFLLLDEVDRYPQDAGDEGSPVELAIARTRTYPNKKIFMNSTPTISGLSVIEQEFEDTDQHYYHVPCPFCGTFQPLEFSQLLWPDGPKSAKYKCVHCEKMIPERYKIQMLAAGQWVPKFPEKSNNDVIGFHINSLYSPYGWYSWAEIAENWINSKDSPNKLKTFVNTTLGETWKERGEAPPYKNLYNRREDYQLNSVPDDVCFITAGVDVQKERIELEIVGWCSDKRSYSIDYRVLEGDTAKAGVWNLLAEVVGERWIKPNGVELPLLKMAVDTGYNTNHVYSFCRRFAGGRVIPIKGQDSLKMAYAPPKSIDVTKSGKRIGKVRLFNVGVSFLKEEVYSALRLEKDSDDVPPPNYCHFPQYDEHYFRGLTAEQYVKKTVHGYTRYYWVKMYERNEPLDCRVYARAAAAVIGLDRKKPSQLEALGGKSACKPAAKKKDAQTRKPRESSIW